jgi:hypothetical protein
MGDVKEAVKGSKKISPKLMEGNLVERFTALTDELGELTAKKDEDALNEGKDVEAENKRKAALLRASTSLVRAAKTLLPRTVAQSASTTSTPLWRTSALTA